MKRCVVERVLWAGPRGGAIFAAEAEGASVRIRAPSALMPRAPVPGEVWEIGGTLRRHPRHGPQVEAQVARLALPSGRLLKRFLQGPHCPGVGTKTAEALWTTLGEDLYAVLDDTEDPRLAEIVGPERATVIRHAWGDMRAEASAMRWCDAHGVPVALAQRLAAIYGAELEAKMRENPYRILAFTSWAKAEALAATVGVPPHDPRRLVGAVETAIYSRLDQGHTAVRRDHLEKEVKRRLASPPRFAHHAVDQALADGALVADGDMLAGAGAAAMERLVADWVRQGSDHERAHTETPDFLAGASHEALEAALDAYERGEDIRLNREQRAAVAAAVGAPVSVITGGAGTGKTTALKALHALAEAYGTPVHQAAVAGRAARRMEEATGRPARTLASLLIALRDGLDLSGSVLVIDEASMLDLPTVYRLLRRLPTSVRLVLVGDASQLPPIAFGLVFHALAHRPEVPTVELRQVHRQAATTGIPAVCLSIRTGRLPELPAYAGAGTGVSFVPCPIEELDDRLLALATDMPDAQILTPVRDRADGTHAINALFHAVHAAGRATTKGFAVGEPVIWGRNDYDLGLMNGSLGRVLGFGDDGLRVRFDEAEVFISGPDLDHLDHAYAITCHKAQGSQFPRVIVPVYPSRILDRSLLYTAITRAQSQVVLLGDQNALKRAIAAEPIEQRRNTGLTAHLDAVRRKTRPVQLVSPVRPEIEREVARGAFGVAERAAGQNWT